MNFQMFKLVLEKAEEPEIKLPTSAGSSKKHFGFVMENMLEWNKSRIEESGENIIVLIQ